MAWNEPGGGRNDDPWGDRKDDPWGRGRGNDQGPPDVDEALRKMQDQLGRIFGGKSGSGGGASGGGGLSTQFVAILAGLAVAAYFVAGFYTLDEQERGVIFRFGAVQEQVAQPGLRWRPIGIDEVEPVNVTRVRSAEHQALMLTEDQNIVDVSLTVQYLVTDPVDFVVKVRSPEDSLKQALESALRHVVGASTMDDVIGQGREAMALDVQARLQDYLTAYGTGITVSTVNLDRGAPPREVQAAFDDVQKAREDEERYVNEARAYAEQVIPEARGDARRILEQANAYRDQVVARATGEADRFSALLVEYQRASRVTRDRLYLDAVEEVLTNTSKVLMDVESGNQMVYLPLDKLAGGAVGGSSGQRSPISSDDVREIADAVIREIESRPSTSTRRPR
ncbi:MAG: FtsH protease activity modulator HflK [Pseudomonadales bacterium]|jgi:membrane protease subunit HflK|nr:FtsH protease activity modulator HflK [Pseudomonadales bacterium]